MAMDKPIDSLPKVAKQPPLLRPYSQKPLASWQSEQLFDRADRYFEQLLNNINQASHTIDIEFYIFHFDALGKRVVDALSAAVFRGVRVRMLLDGVGSAETGQASLKAMVERGIEVKIFHPLPWQLQRHGWSARQGTPLGKLFHMIRSINQRDHRKLCIIDNRVLWSGSLNISQKHLPYDQGGEHWRDYGIRITGSGIEDISANFEALWHHQRPHLRHGLFRYYWNNITALARRRKNRLLVKYIANAKDRIWISSAYFSPSPAVLKAIKRVATQKNLDIRLLVPQKSDVLFFSLLTATYYSDLLKSGIRVFEYGPRFLHAKALLIDELCVIGSTNFNHRSYLHDLELDIVLHSPQAKRELESYFMRDVTEAKEVKLKELGGHRHRVLLGWIPRLLRYWL